MSKVHSKDTDPTESAGRLVYVVPEIRMSDATIDLREFFATLLKGKWLIAVLTSMFTGLSVIYAIYATPWYEASAVLVPAAKNTDGLAGQLGQLGGLASLAGLKIGGNDRTIEAMALLQSPGFIRAFIDDYHLLPVLFADDWDPVKKSWTIKNRDDWPDVRDGVRYFTRKVLRAEEDKKTGVITISVEWKDARLAADWANLLAERANDHMRRKALVDAQTNVDYLRGELTAANIVTLQMSISKLLESEMEKLMVARGNKEFAFRFVDRAAPPKWRSRPKRVQVVVLGIVAGSMLGALIVLGRHFLARGRRPRGVSDVTVPAESNSNEP